MTTAVTRTPNPRGSGDQLRGELVAAARELLLAPREVAPFSLRAVAKTVGVSPTAVYRHFDSAGRLVEAVLDDQNDALRAALGSATPSTVDLPAVTAMALRYVRWGLANPGGYQLLFESADRIGHRGGPGTPGWDMIESLTEVVEHVTAADRASATSLAIRAWSSLHGLTSLRLHKPGLEWPTTIEHEVDVLVGTLFGG
jgi:AcrR family transcriptional regulator